MAPSVALQVKIPEQLNLMWHLESRIGTNAPELTALGRY